ncbi:hypothetical protein EER27_09170 [Lysobacter psychrotolerans]|uniref:Uncharacterized protein n=1 Tax=Montanilutibacter psychrotolerans TaxID=1327343 RepID=A0A3M8T064_9GAMM|nr:hypothetical protein EER27_09170 [Lysobacter psychrotolerans]
MTRCAGVGVMAADWAAIAVVRTAMALGTGVWRSGRQAARGNLPGGAACGRIAMRSDRQDVVGVTQL